MCMRAVTLFFFSCLLLSLRVIFRPTSTRCWDGTLSVQWIHLNFIAHCSGYDENVFYSATKYYPGIDIRFGVSAMVAPLFALLGRRRKKCSTMERCYSCLKEKRITTNGILVLRFHIFYAFVFRFDTLDVNCEHINWPVTVSCVYLMLSQFFYIMCTYLLCAIVRIWERRRVCVCVCVAYEPAPNSMEHHSFNFTLCDIAHTLT